MTVIQKDNNLCTVGVTVDAEAEVMTELEVYAKSDYIASASFRVLYRGICTRAPTASVLFNTYSEKERRHI